MGVQGHRRIARERPGSVDPGDDRLAGARARRAGSSTARRARGSRSARRGRAGPRPRDRCRRAPRRCAPDWRCRCTRRSARAARAPPPGSGAAGPRAAGSRERTGRSPSTVVARSPVIVPREQVRLAHERRHVGVERVGVEVARRGGGGDVAGADDRDAVGHRERLVLIVGDEHGGGSRGAQDVHTSARTRPRAGSRRGRRTARRAAPAAGCTVSARASATRCCWPPESWCGYRDSRPSRPTISTRRRTSSPRRSRRGSPKPTFASTVRCGKSAPSCGT